MATFTLLGSLPLTGVAAQTPYTFDGGVPYYESHFFVAPHVAGGFHAVHYGGHVSGHVPHR